MEIWGTVIVAAIVALSTLGATFLQNWHSNRRFKIELGRAIDVDIRKRRWEIRSKPLLELRDGLAIMAQRLQILVSKTRSLQQRSTANENELQQALDEWRNYEEKGEFLPVLYIQYDEELREQVEGIERDYMLLFEYALDFSKLKTDELRSFRETFKNIKSKIPKVQEMINKRLEEL